MKHSTLLSVLLFVAVVLSGAVPAWGQSQKPWLLQSSMQVDDRPLSATFMDLDPHAAEPWSVFHRAWDFELFDAQELSLVQSGADKGAFAVMANGNVCSACYMPRHTKADISEFFNFVKRLIDYKT